MGSDRTDSVASPFSATKVASEDNAWRFFGATIVYNGFTELPHCGDERIIKQCEQFAKSGLTLQATLANSPPPL